MILPTVLKFLLHNSTQVYLYETSMGQVHLHWDLQHLAAVVVIWFSLFFRPPTLLVACDPFEAVVLLVLVIFSPDFAIYME